MMPTGKSLNCHDCLRSDYDQGFTLIEMLISLAMGLLLIAGLSTLFIADSNVSRAISSRTERMGDLFLASHLMQAALRESISVPVQSFPLDLQTGGRKPLGLCGTPNNKSVSLPANYPTSFPSYPYWDAVSKTITYQTLDGHTGVFQYQRTKNDRIYWLRPDPCVYKFEELMRDLDTANGMKVYNPATNLAVTALGGGMRIDLTSAYINENKQGRSLSLSFMAWPRN